MGDNGGSMKRPVSKHRRAKLIVQLLDVREAAMMDLGDPELAAQLEKCVARAVGAYVAQPVGANTKERSLSE